MRSIWISSISLLLHGIMSFSICSAQPFIDLVSVQHIAIRNSFIDSKKCNAVAEGSWTLANLCIPVKIDSSNLVLAAPGFEYRNFRNDQAIANSDYRTAYLPLTWVHTFRKSRHKFSLTGVYRYNAKTDVDFNHKSDVPGAALIFFRKQSDHLTWKAGAYYSHEFFGNFWLPLLGADVHLGKRITIWSLLPRYLATDYLITPSLHTGILFRGVNESYRLSSHLSNEYFRLNEGYLRAYIDYYIPKTLFVMTLAAGHTLQRRYDYQTSMGMIRTYPQGGLLFQVGIAMRFKTDPLFTTQRTP